MSVDKLKSFLSCIEDQIETTKKDSEGWGCDVCGKNAAYIHVAHRGNISMGGYMCSKCLPEPSSFHPYFNALASGTFSIQIDKIIN